MERLEVYGDTITETKVVDLKNSKHSGKEHDVVTSRHAMKPAATPSVDKQVKPT